MHLNKNPQQGPLQKKSLTGEKQPTHVMFLFSLWGRKLKCCSRLWVCWRGVKNCTTLGASAHLVDKHCTARIAVSRGRGAAGAEGSEGGGGGQQDQEVVMRTRRWLEEKLWILHMLLLLSHCFQETRVRCC